MTREKVKIFDTTLRDGEQAAGAGMTTPEKLEIARQLDRLGVDVIEAGFAASSPGDFEAVATIAREVRRPIIASLARAHPNDVDQAWQAIQGAAHPRIHVFLSSSDIHLMHQLRKNREEVMDMAVTMVSRAKGYCDDVEFSAMDASRTEPEYLYTMLKAVIDAGATTINIPDTVGYSIPRSSPSCCGIFRPTCQISTKRSSASTVTTTLGWEWPTVWRPFRWALVKLRDA